MQRTVKIYPFDSKMDFGKYKGYNILEIYLYVPSYIEWVIINVAEFYVDIMFLQDTFKPTPMNLHYFKIKDLEGWLHNLNPEKDYIQEARKYLGLGNKLEEIEFKFSKEAIEICLRKWNKFLDEEGDEIEVERIRNEYVDTEYYENYGSSTEKYGGYNGYGDDIIDDAFEGNPENTWNID